MKIGKTIIEEKIDLKKIKTHKTRKTVRAIILNEQKEVLMLYSEIFDDYTFPGGGMKSNENKKDALIRELKEETGALNIVIIKKIGHTKEIKYSLGASNTIYIQKSYYFLCEIEKLGNPNYVGRELDQGLKTVWVNIDKAISHNENIKKTRTYTRGMQTVLSRENSVLRMLKRKLNL